MNWVESNLVWNHMRDFKIRIERSTILLLWFQSKIARHEVHFITAVLKSQNSVNANIYLKQKWFKIEGGMVLLIYSLGMMRFTTWMPAGVLPYKSDGGARRTF